MGGICSRSSNAKNPYKDSNAQFDRPSIKTVVVPPPVIGVEDGKNFQDTVGVEIAEAEVTLRGIASASDNDDFYDGIPRYSRALSHKSRSVRSTQAAVAKVSEVSSRLGRASSAGLGKAVEVLDTLGSSMTNFNSGNGFASTAPTKGNEIAILSFEIANTIVKGSNLMQSLSKRSVRQLKEEVLPSQGVQHLISEDTEELLRIVAADKMEDLKVFSREVIRFGNRSKDPQWHNLDRYFEKVSRGVGPQRNTKEEADLVIQHLMTLVQDTADLYHELHALDRYEQEFHRKRLEAEISRVSQKGDSMSILRSELKSQRKLVKNLKKKSLWSKSMEEVMEKLVDVVHFLHLEIQNEFGGADAHTPVEESTVVHNRLGPAGLALHYANMIIQIDTLVARSSNMPQTTREALYQSLPPSLKSSLRSKLKSFHVKEEMTIKEIKDEMEKTLGWLVPVATNTAKAHHGFGWVGEWANTGSDAGRKAALQAAIMKIETLHHADKDKTESCVLDMLLWLHHLASQSKSNNTAESKKPPPTLINAQKAKDTACIAPTLLSAGDREILEAVPRRKRAPGISKSLDFDSDDKKRGSIRRSRSFSPQRRGREVQPISRVGSGIRIPGFGVDKERVLDIMDRVEPRR